MSGATTLERTLQHCVHPADLDRIHELLADLFSDAGDVDGRDRIGFELAVIEVAGNIAEHSLQTPGFTCDLVVRVQPDRLEAEFRDSGQEIEVDLDDAQMPDELAESGRGLAIARAAVNELSYQREGDNNTWRIRRDRTIPEPAPSVANPRRLKAAQAAPPKPGIVLVVEDDPDLGGFLQAALGRKVDRQVRLAQDALLAMKILSEESVDVLVTDIQMPGMTGLEMVSKVRQSFPALPIIMMTAHASVEYAISALRHQVDEFLVKPVSAAELVPKVKELAERGAAARQTARALLNVDPAATAEVEMVRLEREMLKDLANTMGLHNSLSQQLEQAAKVQRDLLPRSAPALPGWDLAGTCVPSFAIGGDFFDWYPRAGGVEFVVADVMGKGIPAALVTATVRAVMRGIDLTSGPGASMRSAAASLTHDLEETGTFVTMFLGQLDGETGTLCYADAGHGLSLHVRADGSVGQLLSDDLPLGVEPGGGTARGENVITLGPGDSLVSFSDGLFDLLGGDRQAIDEIAAIISSSANCADIIARVEALAAGNTLIDDVTVVALRRNRTPTAPPGDIAGTTEGIMTAPYHVLVVEDDPDVAEFVKLVLIKRAGMIVQMANNADLAFELLQQHEFDALITDIEMPGASGLDLVARVRQLRPQLPIVVMTAHASVDYAVTALRHAADEFLTKPISSAYLVSRMTALAERGRADRIAAAGQVVLAIGAHPDDVEIGVGGLLAAHRAGGDSIVILTMSRGDRGGDPNDRQHESLASADLLDARLFLEDLVDTKIGPADPTVSIIERVVAEVSPSIVYTHSAHDRHQDHRAVHQASTVATRRVPTVACYQSPSATVDYQPNRFVPIDGFTDAKMALLACFASQSDVRAYLEPDFVLATARYWSRFGGGRSCEPLEVIRDTSGIGQAGTPSRRVAAHLPGLG